MTSKLIVLIIALGLLSCSSNSEDNSNTPLPATNLIVVNSFPNQIKIKWNDNSTNENGFKIERKNNIGTFSIIGSVGTNITEFNDTGLTQNTEYIYRVYPFNSSGDSTTYSNEVIAVTTSPINITSITIGSQIWQNTNLNVSTYRDGTPIPQITDPIQWKNLTIGAWCYYENLTPNGVEHGKLYNWYAVAGIYDSASFSNPSLRKQLAPDGWHVPSESEWNVLSNFLGGASIAGGKMKVTGNTYWNYHNGGGATNSSGFSARGSGAREYSSVFDLVGFGNMGLTFNCWSSTPINTSTLTNAKSIYLIYSNTSFSTNNTTTKNGYSVRCVKD